MKGLKIIPAVFVVIAMTYLGILFVELNRTEVTVSFGNHQAPPTAVGFVVLTSVLFGMVLCGALCSIELMALYLQNKRLRRRLPPPPALSKKEVKPTEGASDIVNPRTSGRFT